MHLRKDFFTKSTRHQKREELREHRRFDHMYDLSPIIGCCELIFTGLFSHFNDKITQKLKPANAGALYTPRPPYWFQHGPMYPPIYTGHRASMLTLRKIKPFSTRKLKRPLHMMPSLQMPRQSGCSALQYLRLQLYSRNV